VKEKMADLFDDSFSQEVKDELVAHIHNCNDCRQYYEKMSTTMDELKPRVTVTAGRDFQSRVLDKAVQGENPYQSRRIRIRPMLTPTWKKVTAIAAVLVILFFLFPIFNRSGLFQNKANAASTILDNSINAFTSVKSMYMEFSVRTLEGDNFEYINTKEGFVEHKLWKVFGNPSKWRIEKPARTVVMDGKNQYMYINQASMALKANPNSGFMGWMSILLDPANILYKEKENARHNGSKFLIEFKGNTITMTIKAKAIGNFSNSYMLNKSIPESNNRRVYTFDKSTYLLKSFDVYVDSAGKEVQVLEIKNIKYNEPVDDANFTIKLPENMNWVDVIDIETQTGISAGTSAEVAKQFFTACHEEDWATVRQLIPGFSNFIQFQFDVKAQYGGLTIISIGKPFKSGRYVGEFVPYEVKMKNGWVKKWTIALRNDNKDKKWTVDGGF
jgi:outer membrane lipoprotein-sorting protein